MSRLPSLKPKQVLAALLSTRAGFYLDRSSGSHHLLKHPDKPSLRVTIPIHNRDLSRRTLHSIIKQADLTIEEFVQLL